MNRLLLDTHTFIWFVSNDANLPPSIIDQIEFTEDVFLSIASIWEIGIKVNIGKLTLQGTFEDIESQLIYNNIKILPLTFSDTVQLRYLPLYHRDPFDRILIAQAINNSLILISRDSAFDAYSIQRLW
ncbi:type II toxin-antitoxin system VapC family toxin [Anabaena sp. FACHB-1237]|uniref:type II toxin-antitoxin system VapC family toxin n=1 Tax=Anabaena sp. FACHB-1237 TaxID=2692769 RepID=UPI0016814999|nr:type II toxin-antitoxin system VapC family toxin [Anabaena sp. FACHB-1237]MBD2139037.1 type II toxin-antitoxin system VapC family toxin [Anabaena sp. FACHB-1237]